MRAYDVTAAALALGVERKWIDNVLSRHRLAGVSRERQGVRRRLAPGAVLELAAVLDLVLELGLPLPAALRLAPRLLAHEGTLQTGSRLTVRIDLARLERDVLQRLAEAAEATPPPRRGRPPKSAARVRSRSARAETVMAEFSRVDLASRVPRSRKPPRPSSAPPGHRDDAAAQGPPRVPAPFSANAAPSVPSALPPGGRGSAEKS